MPHLLVSNVPVDGLASSGTKSFVGTMTNDLVLAPYIYIYIYIGLAIEALKLMGLVYYD